MTFFIGTKGNVRLRRGADAELGVLSATVNSDDLVVALNRVGIEGAVDNLFSGDRILVAHRREILWTSSEFLSLNSEYGTFSVRRRVSRVEISSW